jgi:hypothetical protein
MDTQVHNGTDISSPTPLLPQFPSISCAYPPPNARNEFVRTLFVFLQLLWPYRYTSTQRHRHFQPHTPPTPVYIHSLRLPTSQCTKRLHSNSFCFSTTPLARWTHKYATAQTLSASPPSYPSFHLFTAPTRLSIHETSSFELLFHVSTRLLWPYGYTSTHLRHRHFQPHPLLPQFASIPCAYLPLNARNDFVQTRFVFLQLLWLYGYTSTQRHKHIQPHTPPPTPLCIHFLRQPASQCTKQVRSNLFHVSTTPLALWIHKYATAQTFSGTPLPTPLCIHSLCQPTSQYAKRVHSNSFRVSTTLLTLSIHKQATAHTLSAPASSYPSFHPFPAPTHLPMHETSSFELVSCFYNSSGPMDTQVCDGTDIFSHTPSYPSLHPFPVPTCLPMHETGSFELVSCLICMVRGSECTQRGCSRIGRFMMRMLGLVKRGCSSNRDIYLISFGFHIPISIHVALEYNQFLLPFLKIMYLGVNIESRVI